ncbi:MAG: XdhC/CoxI family protein [Chloroflexi bacterium]|nr:XdhC/CoxI family protein [Chloroflexota bacterium]
MDAQTRMQIVQQIEAALQGGHMVVTATVTVAGDPPVAAPGDKMLVGKDGHRVGSLGDAALDDAVHEVALSVFTDFPRVVLQTLYFSSDGRAVTRRSQARPGDAEIMVQLFEAPARLVVIGGGHVGLAVATIGDFVGFDVTVLDDREEFANRERFPMAEAIHAGDTGEALAGMTFGPQDYVVLVSRGHKQDEDALRAVAGRGAGYVGMIGSRRRTATVIQHLAEEGFDMEALNRVSTPVGIDLGAETPEEIALSILAEIVMLRRGGGGGRMREQRAPIRWPVR